MSVNLNLTKLVLPKEDRHTVSGPLVSTTGSHDVKSHVDRSGSKGSRTNFTPPTTPEKPDTPLQYRPATAPEIIDYDFSKLDYELDRANLLGSGLWSDVYLAEPTSPQSCQMSPTTLLTPPATPQKVPQSSRTLTYAVKTPIRRDAHEVFQQEAKILTHIHRHTASESFIVPFHGLDPRNSALVFTALQSGSLNDLSNRMSQMTELCRHQDLVLHFPSLAHDLTSGLEFLHTTAGVIHADIKPANILLSPSPNNPKHFQARYADFSASFHLDSSSSPTSTLPAGGGTWTFLAPEQLRLSKADNAPTPASDTWSLGLSLLSLIILGSPYTAACGDNAFRLREAIKTGDPLGFAAMDPPARKRMQACQSFVDFCRLALQKDRGRRIGAEAWRGWVGRQGWGGGGEVGDCEGGGGLVG